MPAAANLAISVTAKIDDFLRKFRRMERRFKRFTRTVRNVARRVKQLTIALSGMAVAGGIALGKLALSGESFNRKMRNSLAIMSGVGPKMAKEMKRTAIDVAATTQFSASEAAEAYYYLASAGLSAEQSLKALPVVAKFAQAGMFDMATATSLLTDAQSALGLKVSNAAKNMQNMKRIADVLVRANTLADASVQEFAEALANKAAAGLKLVNKSVEEGVAMLAAFADQGRKAAAGGEAMYIVMRDLQRAAVKFPDAFKRLNVAVYNAGKMRNLAMIMADLEDALASMSHEDKKRALMMLGFQERSVAYTQMLLGSSRALSVFESQLMHAGGTMERVAERQLTPLQKAMAKLGASIVQLGLSLQPIVTVAAKLFANLAEKVKSWAEILTPEVIVDYLRTALNEIDIFIMRATRNISLFLAGVVSTMATFKNTLSFGFSNTSGLEKLAESLFKVSESTNDSLEKLEKGDLAEFGTLWGEQFVDIVSAPLKQALEELGGDKLRNVIDTVRGLFDRAVFEGTRILINPIGAAKSLLRKLGVLGNKLKTPPEAVSNIVGSGVSIRAGQVSPLITPFRAPQTKIRVYQMDTLVNEVRRQTRSIDDLDDLVVATD
jgi:TP901 family phage tail tape measure protein